MSRRASNNPAGKISRRAVLRGLGVTMALPWLESVAALAGEDAAAISSDINLTTSYFVYLIDAPVTNIFKALGTQEHIGLTTTVH